MGETFAEKIENHCLLLHFLLWCYLSHFLYRIKYNFDLEKTCSFLALPHSPNSDVCILNYNAAVIVLKQLVDAGDIEPAEAMERLEKETLERCLEIIENRPITIKSNDPRLQR